MARPADPERSSPKKAETGQRAWSRYNPGMYRIALVVLIVALGGLQYRLWVADGGWSEVHRLTRMKHDLHAVNGRNQARNDALQAEVDDLKAGERATEGRARSDMGMIKRDEEFFLTVAHPDMNQAVQQAAR